MGAAVIVASCVLVARGERVSVAEPVAVEVEPQGVSVMAAFRDDGRLRWGDSHAERRVLA